MSENKPVKRGVLSGLMGLFGDEEAAGHAPEAADAGGSGPVSLDSTPMARASDDPSPGDPRRSEVVREAYEPGWYRISAAMSARGRDDLDDDDEEEEEGEPAAEEGPYSEEPVAAEPAAASSPSDEMLADEAADEASEPEASVVAEVAEPAPEPAASVVAELVEPAPEPGQVEALLDAAPVAEEAGFEASVAEMPGPEPAMEEPVFREAYAGDLPETVDEPEQQEPQVSDDPGPYAQTEEQPPPAAATVEVAPDTSPVVAEDPRETPVQDAQPIVVHDPEPVRDADPVVVAAQSPADRPLEDQPAPEAMMAGQAEPPSQEPPSRDDTGDPRLQSRDPSQRRDGVLALAAAGLPDEGVAALAAMVQDPERAIRVLVLQTLSQRADVVDAETVRSALRDPVDQVRATGVRLAGARSVPDVPEVFAVAAERHWPLSQQAALEVLPALAERSGISDDAARALLSSVGHMDSQPAPAEHQGLSALARTIGHERLATWLDAGERANVGAARLLLEEDSEAALSALAHRSADDNPEMRFLIEQAGERLGRAEPEQMQELAQPAGQDDDHLAEGGEVVVNLEDEMVAGLARALQDPDEGVRQRAQEALGSLHHDQVAGWVTSSLASDQPDRAALGAEVAAARGLADLIPRVLERAVSVTPEARAPFVRALSTLGVSGEAVPGLVSSAQPEHRPDIVRLLWQVVGRHMLAHVPPLLEDSSAQVRLAALEVIGESADPRSIEMARSVLERDSSPVVRATAIQVIGRAGLDQREASLQRALADPDPDVRATAVELLLTGLGGQAAHVLLRALSDADERVWRAAVRSLADVPEHERGVVWTAIVQCPPDRREDLLASLEQTSSERVGSLALEHLMAPDPHERTMAVLLAGRSGTPEAVRGMASALQDPAAPVRRAAATALAGLRRPSAIPGLAGSLYDPDVEVRVEAVRGLSEIDDDDVLDPLISALKDPEVRVRDVAGQALVRWRSPAVAKRLAIALGDPSLRRSAGEVLAQMGTAAVDPLVDLLAEQGAEVAPTVGQLLRDLAGPDLFLERLGSMDPDERRRAVEALGAMGGEAGLDGLARALSDPVERIRIRAVTLMGESRDPRAFEAVKRTFLGDPVQEVVAAAEEALQKLQPGVQRGPN